MTPLPNTAALLATRSRAVTGVAAVALVAGLAVAVPAGPAAAAGEGRITTTVAYNCATDVYRLTFQDLTATGDGNAVGFGVGFVVKGATEIIGTSALGSPNVAVWEENTDAVGAYGVNFTRGDNVDVWLEENPNGEPTAASMKTRGRKIGSFTYCGIDSAAKKSLPSNSAARTFTYAGWTGKVSYDCKVPWGKTTVGALSSQITSGKGPYIQTVFVHKGGAGVLGGGFSSFRASTYTFKTLMPRLAAGDRIDVYAIPYDWTIPVPIYPDTALAKKIAASKDAELVYAFKYGTCGTIRLPGEGPTLYQYKVTWPKAKTWPKSRFPKGVKPGNRYTVQTCSTGAGKTCTKVRSTGKKRKATVKGLEVGKYVAKVRSLSPSGKSKPYKVKFAVTSKSRPST